MYPLTSGLLAANVTGEVYGSARYILFILDLEVATQFCLLKRVTINLRILMIIIMV